MNIKKKKIEKMKKAWTYEIEMIKSTTMKCLHELLHLFAYKSGVTKEVFHFNNKTNLYKHKIKNMQKSIQNKKHTVYKLWKKIFSEKTQCQTFLGYSISTGSKTQHHKPH